MEAIKLPVLAFLAGSSVIAGINAPAISQAFDEFNQNFSEARADSSRVRSALGRIALISIILILFLYAFGENLEILAYLFWPALVVLGAAFKERAIQPLISS